MGISTEVHRARIGSHNIKAKYEVSCGLKVKFCYVMLILFYVSVLCLLIMFYLCEFYFPCLKQLLKQDGSGNNVVVWFVCISVQPNILT